MNVAEKLVEILQNEDVNNIFGIPGEQIMPFYRALQKSDIKHILTKHEQSAAHAADGYTRSSGKIGVCISTASPGALNFTMALATAYKDNVPILVLTGDNDLDLRKTDYFQSLPVSEIFSNITQKTYSPLNGTEAVYALKAALLELKNNPLGPVHINLSRDVLESEDFEDFDLCYLCENDLSQVDNAQKLIDISKKPLFLLGSGALNQRKTIEYLSKTFNIPLVTTFNARGVISQDDDLNLGMCGIRSTPRADYAVKNSDCIIALGTRLCERTLENIPDYLIHVNLNSDVLKGNYRVCGNVSEFLEKTEFKKTEWLDEILKIDNTVEVKGIDDDLKPQAAIKRILDRFSEAITVGDAGSHITWVTLLHKSIKPRQLLFSGGLAPMGYSVPAAIGSALATGEQVVVINGDGDFQMNMQELSTIKENNLDIIIFIINNSQYGIIRQWQENFYDMNPYQVELNNPDFLKIAAAYNIDSIRIDNLYDLEYFLDNRLTGPLVVDVIVDYEEIPLP